MIVSLIVAMGQQRQIGLRGQIPWHLKEDLQNFKRITMGHTLVLGRKTFESIGKPLPGRKTIVISQNTNYLPQGCTRVSSLPEAIELARSWGEQELFIAGGSQVYASALPLVDKLYLSFVDYKGEADTYFPAYSLDKWRRTHSQGFPVRDDAPSWTFEVWEKTP